MRLSKLLKDRAFLVKRSMLFIPVPIIHQFDSHDNDVKHSTARSRYVKQRVACWFAANNFLTVQLDCI